MKENAKERSPIFGEGRERVALGLHLGSEKSEGESVRTIIAIPLKYFPDSRSDMALKTVLALIRGGRKPLEKEYEEGSYTTAHRDYI